VILVTGGTGFVGAHVVHAIRREGRPVRALVRSPASVSARKLTAWGCELARGDMVDAESVRAAARGCDTVVHLVAIRSGRPEEFERLMVGGTRTLVAAAKEAGVERFVLMSALGTSDETKDLSPYYRAKWTQEREVETSGIPHTIFRPSFIFGRDGGVLPIFVRQVRWSPVVPVVVGERRLQPIWVEDVAAYFAKAVETTGSDGRAFELGGPDAVTWTDFFERIKRRLGKRRVLLHMPTGLVRAGATVIERLPRPLITRDDLRALEHTDQTCDIAPAVEAFGVRPIPLEEQLRRAL
jgi:NADH dehydrogenase